MWPKTVHLTPHPPVHALLSEHKNKKIFILCPNKIIYKKKFKYNLYYIFNIKYKQFN